MESPTMDSFFLGTIDVFRSLRIIIMNSNSAFLPADDAQALGMLIGHLLLATVTVRNSVTLAGEVSPAVAEAITRLLEALQPLEDGTIDDARLEQVSFARDHLLTCMYDLDAVLLVSPHFARPSVFEADWNAFQTIELLNSVVPECTMLISATRDAWAAVQSVGALLKRLGLDHACSFTAAVEADMGVLTTMFVNLSGALQQGVIPEADADELARMIQMATERMLLGETLTDRMHQTEPTQGLSSIKAMLESLNLGDGGSVEN